MINKMFQWVMCHVMQEHGDDYELVEWVNGGRHVKCRKCGTGMYV